MYSTVSVRMHLVKFRLVLPLLIQLSKLIMQAQLPTPSGKIIPEVTRFL